MARRWLVDAVRAYGLHLGGAAFGLLIHHIFYRLPKRASQRLAGLQTAQLKGNTTMNALQSVLAVLKAMLPTLEPIAQAQVDAFLVQVEGQIQAGNASPDWKLVEVALLGALKVIIDAEGQKLVKA
jgi:hypothetical protein